MRHLCDSNILLALVTQDHAHYETTRHWFDSLEQENTVAVCRAVQISFLRLLATEQAMKKDVCTNTQAIAIMENLLKHPRCEFVGAEPADLDANWIEFAHMNAPAPKLWMDAYLAAFAMGFRMRFVTLDKGCERYRKHGLDLLVLKTKK